MANVGPDKLRDVFGYAMGCARLHLDDGDDTAVETQKYTPGYQRRQGVVVASQYQMDRPISGYI